MIMLYFNFQLTEQSNLFIYNHFGIHSMSKYEWNLYAYWLSIAATCPGQ